MTNTYTKSLATHFGGLLNPSQLLDEIQNDQNISPFCITVSNTSDNVDIIFNSSLSSGEETALDTLISNYQADMSIPKNYFYSINPESLTTTNQEYTALATGRYAGYQQIGIINYIEVISRKDDGVTSYDIRVIDLTNGNTLAEKQNLTNNRYEIIDLGTITNIPKFPSILEIQGKIKTHQNKLYIKEAIVYHGN